MGHVILDSVDTALVEAVYAKTWTFDPPPIVVLVQMLLETQCTKKHLNRLSQKRGIYKKIDHKWGKSRTLQNSADLLLVRAG